MEAKRALDNLCQYCLGIKKGETVFILADAPSKEMAALLEQGASRYTDTVITMFIPVTPRDGAEPPAAAARAMAQADVVLAPTTKSITHTQARIAACEKGARIASMPGITQDMFIRGLNADYPAIKERSTRVAALLDSGSQVRITSEAGTDISFSIQGRQAIAETGLLTEPGSFGNLPAGEAYLAPVEGTAQGIVVFDGMMAGVGLLKEPIKAYFTDGKAMRIEGATEARQLQSILADVEDDRAYNLAEFGVGTNEAVRITGKFLEDEKVLGTIHLAFGNNISMGGHNQVSVHLDGLVKEPTVTVDGTLIIKNGQLLL